MQQHTQCRNENLSRLNLVDKLEDLVNFKVTTLADKLKEDSLHSPMMMNTHESSILIGHTSKGKGSIFDSNMHSSENTLNLLKSICDPLLGSQWPPRLLNSNKKQDRYEIPSELKELPKNYNKFIPLKNIIPKYTKQ